jgi:tight adherence protein C
MRGAALAAGLATASIALALGAGLTGREQLVPLSGTPPPSSSLRRVAGLLGELSALHRISRPTVLAARLATAGSSARIQEVVGAKWLLAIAAFVGVSFLTGSMALAAPVAFGAFVLPDLVVSRAARRRQALVEREVPVLLDLLAVAATAGLGGQLALRRAAEAVDGPLAEALGVMLRRVDLGGRWREELVAVAGRLDLPDLRRAVSVLTRSEVIGSTYVDALAEIARDSRETRRAAATERARKAPVKMLFPLVFLVLPAFLLLTVVPVLVTTLRSID